MAYVHATYKLGHSVGTAQPQIARSWRFACARQTISAVITGRDQDRGTFNYRGRAVASGQLLEDHCRLNSVATAKAAALCGRGRDRVQPVPLGGLLVELALELGEVP